ncbi:MAG: amidotransferase 1, exosortase A system-associated [Burkholderiaceae bacterium]|nr:amidotransferase 1, exosortase A system-associated [Burkholderiaceae bacterium]
MCGLAGLFSPRADAPRVFERALLKRMTDSIAHRGPDAEGFHVEPHVALGHRRLSIIDIATGQQPMFNEDGSVVVSYNGEIYNFQELAAELERSGHHFHTRSDTEVIVHAWEQWGEDCVKRFRGMFAFALWDRNRRTLFLARDRLGVKPLFWCVLADGAVGFASELKALKLLPGFDTGLNDHAIEDYFAFGYIPDPKTIHRNAYKLEPAHTLRWSVGEREPRVRQYWDISFEPDQRITLQDAAHELRERISEAVRIRMISEVPLGAFLSGGVDSSAVVAAMAGLTSEAVKTCSIAFDVAEFDESRFAQMVAERYRTDHYVETVRSDDFDLIDRLPDLFDEPFADSSALPTYRVCELARKRVTVALSGDGGDETFGGYRRYRLHLMEDRLRAMLPIALRRPVFGALGRAFPKLDWMPRPFRAKTTLQALARDSVEAYFHSVSVMRDEDRQALYSPEFKRRLGGYNAIEVFRAHAARAPSDQPLALIQYLDYKTYLPGDINTKVDRASMANSLEVREPLMDHLLVEWAARLDQSLKISGAESKLVLKRAMEPQLPDEVLYRPKAGFAVPLANWFRGPLAARSRARISSVASESRFNTGHLGRLQQEHARGRRDWSASIWSVMCFPQGLPPEQIEATR